MLSVCICQFEAFRLSLSAQFDMAFIMCKCNAFVIVCSTVSVDKLKMRKIERESTETCTWGGMGVMMGDGSRPLTQLNQKQNNESASLHVTLYGQRSRCLEKLLK